MEMIKKSVAAMQQQPTWLSEVAVVRQACKVGLLGSLALAGLMLLGGAARAGEAIHNVLDLSLIHS